MLMLLLIMGNNSDTTFVLDGKYSKLKISAVIREGCRDSLAASFTIKIDDGNREFKNLFRIRNGVETVPSLLQRKYHVDRCAVRG